MNDKFSSIRRILVDAASLATTLEWQERLTAAVHDLDALAERQKALEEEAADLKEQCGESDQQPEGAGDAGDFVEYRGALFKRNGVGFDPDVYCKFCRIPMNSLMNHLPYRCSDCRRDVGFSGGDLSAILAAIPR